jgi:hypothetical protein
VVSRQRFKNERPALRNGERAVHFEENAECGEFYVAILQVERFSQIQAFLFRIRYSIFRILFTAECVRRP